MTHPPCKSLYIFGTVFIALCAPTAKALPTVKATGIGIAALPYLKLSQQYVAILQKISACLATVHDKATAEAAAPTVAELTYQLRGLKRQESKLPRPSRAVQEYLKTNLSENSLKDLCRQSAGHALQLTILQEPACYGSLALQTELAVFLDTLSSTPEPAEKEH
ncbi:MAG: hypothetical protein E7033_00625 [Akkermansiaceae bacterium]|nr:hypothetical protein [Akkermansiaceae bacterium]